MSQSPEKRHSAILAGVALVGIYLTQKPDVEKARAVVRRAQAYRKWIAPEYLEKLERLR